MKSMTLEEFKRFGPCWLKTSEGREKLESIGRRKERWRAWTSLTCRRMR